MLAQLDVLAAERTRIKREAATAAGATDPRRYLPVPRSDVARDVMLAGLVALKRDGLAAPGFAPGRARREAAQRGEPY